MRSSLLLNRRLIINSNDLEKLIDYYKGKKLAHAYLISTNNLSKCYQVLLNVIKNIFCVQEYSDNCNKCSLCHLIDINNLPSLVTIEPDGNFIKKEQIQNLRNIFSKDSQFTKESIYIIKNAEKMNKESANTMLKFLEEPNGNVIGFFLTNNKNNIMLTIQSRCQIIEQNFLNETYEEYGMDKEKYEYFKEITIKYLNEIEKKDNKLILNNKEFLENLEKEDVIIIFKILLSIYKSELDERYGLSNEYKINMIKNLSSKNIKNKINLIIDFLKEITYNVNINLLLDRFVIEMDGINHEII